MNAVGSSGDGDVGARVDEEAGSQFPVLSSQCGFFANDIYSLLGQDFQFLCAQILFAQLDVVNPSAGGFGDFVEKPEAARRFIAGELRAVGDVVKISQRSEVRWQK